MIGVVRSIDDRQRIRQRRHEAELIEEMTAQTKGMMRFGEVSRLTLFGYMARPGAT